MPAWQLGNNPKANRTAFSVFTWLISEVTLALSWLATGACAAVADFRSLFSAACPARLLLSSLIQ